MANVNYEDKDKNIKDGVHNYFRDIDANEVKRAVNSKIDADKIGVPNGITPLGLDGKIPAQYLEESESAEDIPITPTGDLEATNVADAIAELEAEKEPRLGYVPESVGNKATNLTETTSNTKYPSVKAVSDGIAAGVGEAKAYADAINTNVLNFRGYWNPTGGTVYPTTGGTGTAGAIEAGNTWEIDTAGGGYDVGDLIVAKFNTPGQTAANWGKTAHNTTQATEVARGTAMLATTAEMQDAATTNDIDIVTPKKFWVGIAYFLSQAWTFAAKLTLTLAPRFSSTTAGQYLKVDNNKDLISVATIPGADVGSATDTQKGAVELATSTEVKTGTDTVRAVTPAGLAARINRLPVFEFSADLISSTNLTLSGVGQVVQGEAVIAGKVVVVNAQTDPLQNGIYIVDAGAWLRIGVSYNNDTYNYAGNFEGTRIFNRKDKKFYVQTATATEIGTTGQTWSLQSGTGGGGGGAGTLEETLTLGNNAGGLKITNLQDPTSAQDADTKAARDAAIGVETSARAAAITTTNGLITAEAAARAAADTTLNGLISAETAARTSAISAEASARASADSTLNGQITTEATARSSADIVLQNAIDSVQDLIFISDLG